MNPHEQYFSCFSKQCYGFGWINSPSAEFILAIFSKNSQYFANSGCFPYCFADELCGEHFQTQSNRFIHKLTAHPLFTVCGKTVAFTRREEVHTVLREGSTGHQTSKESTTSERPDRQTQMITNYDNQTSKELTTSEQPDRQMQMITNYDKRRGQCLQNTHK